MKPSILEMPARNLEGSTAKLRRRLAGDLDDIVMMALRKEPERRYGSVEQFAEDIRRNLEGLPVTATRLETGILARPIKGSRKCSIRIPTFDLSINPVERVCFGMPMQ